MKQYLVYWKPNTVTINIEDDGEEHRLRHTASQQYRHVAIGDVLWIVSSSGQNQLVLLGRQHVDQLTNYKDACRILKTTNLWESGFHAISNDPEDAKLIDISLIARKLSFDGVVPYLPNGFTGRNLQTMRCLTQESIKILEDIWDDRENLPEAPWYSND